MLERLIISAPFGNYIRGVPRVTSTRGTFTLFSRRTDQIVKTLGYVGRDERFWRLGMLWRVSRTLRYRPSMLGWTNRLGLRNPGIMSLDKEADYSSQIISVRGMMMNEWPWVIGRAIDLQPLAIELNLSCPNVGDHVCEASLNDAMIVTRLALEQCRSAGRQGLREPRVIVKIPPLNAVMYGTKLGGISHHIIIHACNTIPCAHGGLSGEMLRRTVLPIVRTLRRELPGNTIVAGGGVSDATTALEYVHAGADHIAVASTLLSPTWWLRRRCKLIELSHVVSEEYDRRKKETGS